MSSKLNLFKFAQKHKGSNTGDVEPHHQQLSDEAHDPHEELNFIDIGTEEPYSPESDSYQEGGPIRSPSEASLIFERSVEDPSQVFQQNSCPRCGANSNDTNGLKCNHQSIANLPSHYSVENFVSPCLDATTKILTDDSTDLDNVDMVYSRRPSNVMNLSMALNGGRTKSYIDEASVPQYPQQRTRSFASVKDLESPGPTRPPVLSFYSYADMINNEQPNPRRPSISQSLSSSFLNSRSNSITSNSNKFQAGNSITPKRNSIANNSSRPSFSCSPLNAINNPRIPISAKNFSLNPDNVSPNSSEDESDYNHTSLASRISRSSSRKQSQPDQDRRFSAHQSLLSRTNSNQSSLLSGSSSRHFKAGNQIDMADDNDEMVVSSIGERLRRNTGEIRSN